RPAVNARIDRLVASTLDALGPRRQLDASQEHDAPRADASRCSAVSAGRAEPQPQVFTIQSLRRPDVHVRGDRPGSRRPGGARDGSSTAEVLSALLGLHGAQLTENGNPEHCRASLTTTLLATYLGYPMPQNTPLTIAERMAKGKALRERVPRTAHASW